MFILPYSYKFIIHINCLIFSPLIISFSWTTIFSISSLRIRAFSSWIMTVYDIYYRHQYYVCTIECINIFSD